MIIKSICIGEHTIEIAPLLVNWIIDCLKKGMSPRKFKKEYLRIWDDFPEEEEDKFEWFDELQLDDPDDVPYLYNDIYKFKHDKSLELIIFNNNSFVDIVLATESPTNRDIIEFIFKEDVFTPLEITYYSEMIEKRIPLGTILDDL